MDLTDRYRTLYKATEYTYFSSTYGTLSRIDHMLGHKISLNKLETIVIMHHNKIKLETNNRRKLGRLKNMWRLNNILLNNQWVK